MKIGVDGGCLGVSDKRLKVGVYRVVVNLLEQLGKIDKKNSYLLYSFYPIKKSLMERFGERMRNVVIKPSRGWAKIWLPLRISKDKPDVFLGLSQFIPKILPFYPRPYTIGFVYDLVFEIYPDMYPGSSKKLSKQTKNMVKNSNHIIAISQSTKNDLIKFCNADHKKIDVVYCACSNTFTYESKKNNNKDKYFLSAGSLKKTKNIPGLIKGYEHFLSNTDDAPMLYIAGGDKWLDPEIKKTLEEIPKSIRDKIKFLGFVEDDTLRDLYKNATAFVSPSFYEGFGIPFLEAMSCGCPVICSKSGSIPEVVGNAGLYVNPENPKEIGNALLKIFVDKNLKQKLIKKGLEKAKQFSWKNSAKKIFDLYNNPL
ncbi:MAG: glycosyltransferase family 1 protein [Candidatus Levybacteria bacterium]|nr:glycosyltransferase family 1 protein [Candidatus Levybacteria bacterium]